MIEIIKVLLEFGMSFQYECYNSQDEEIESHELGFKLLNQEGKLHFTYDGETKTGPENAENFRKLAYKLESICIHYTT